MIEPSGGGVMGTSMGTSLITSCGASCGASGPASLTPPVPPAPPVVVPVRVLEQAERSQARATKEQARRMVLTTKGWNGTAQRLPAVTVWQGGPASPHRQGG